MSPWRSCTQAIYFERHPIGSRPNCNATNPSTTNNNDRSLRSRQTAVAGDAWLPLVRWARSVRCRRRGSGGSSHLASDRSRGGLVPPFPPPRSRVGTSSAIWPLARVAGFPSAAAAFTAQVAVSRPYIAGYSDNDKDTKTARPPAGEVASTPNLSNDKEHKNRRPIDHYYVAHITPRYSAHLKE
jgi:hypothetical protein